MKGDERTSGSLGSPIWKLLGSVAVAALLLRRGIFARPLDLTAPLHYVEGKKTAPLGGRYL